MHYMHSVLSICTSLMYTCVTVLRIYINVDLHGIAIKQNRFSLLVVQDWGINPARIANLLRWSLWIRFLMY